MTVNALARQESCYGFVDVDWKTIRAAFVRHRGKRTQADIAADAGIRQNDVSRLEANDNLGPSVETFVRAVEGLGLKPSEFFREIEGGQPQTHNAGVKPATIGEIPDGKSVGLPTGLTAKACRDLVRIFEDAAEQLAKTERLSTKNRRPGSRKAG